MNNISSSPHDLAFYLRISYKDGREDILFTHAVNHAAAIDRLFDTQKIDPSSIEYIICSSPKFI